jgi:putative nucleotidyltransferase with HDIG domain
MQHRLQRHAVDNTRGIQEQRRQLQEALDRSETQLAEMLLNAADVKGHETRAHCRRVAAYAEMIARQMGLAGSTLTSIRQGALLHDVGTIIVPDSVLCKDGPLSEQEWELMHQHPVVGARVLDGIESLRGAQGIVLQHHERYNGGGYPYGLAGDTICLGARIFAVADTLDAVLGDRPYRAPIEITAAVEKILNGSGTCFDPAVVDAFAALDRDDLMAVQEMYPDPAPARCAPALCRVA